MSKKDAPEAWSAQALAEIAASDSALATRIDAAQKIIDSSSDSMKIAQAYADIGQIFFDKKSPDLATHYFKKALTINPCQENALRSVAQMMFSYKETFLSEEYGRLRGLEALNRYDNLLNVYPEDFMAHMNMAYLYMHQKNYEDAWAHAGEAMDVKPDEFAVHFIYAQLYINIGGNENYMCAEEILTHPELGQNNAEYASIIQRELYVLYFLRNRLTEAFKLPPEDLEYAKKRIEILRKNYNPTHIYIPNPSPYQI